MSMLSPMCENLRLMARLVRDYDYREISRSLREAADTIDELRCRCQDAQAENASLRGAAQGLGELCDRYKAENAKLKRFAKLDENTIDVLHSCIEDLNEETAKLREELAKARDPQRIGGQADPSSFVYAIEQLREFRWQHATNDEDAVPYINNVAEAHERETAKLRELVDVWMGCGTKYHTMQGGCPLFDASAKNFCKAEEMARELGIEVG